jgi:hypothetical protein
VLYVVAPDRTQRRKVVFEKSILVREAGEPLCHQSPGEVKAQMKLTILYVVVVGAFLFWWLRRVKPKRRI